MLRYSFWTIIVFVLAVAGIVTAAEPALGQSYDETIHVDGNAGADDNPGTEAEPLQSIQEAMNRATDYKNDGRSVHVVIAGGTYRESVQFAYSNYNGNGTGAPVLVEGAGPTATVIRGSDVFESEEWQNEGNGVFSHTWTKDWGTANDPTGGYIENCGAHPKYCAHSPELVLRREMVFVNGERMRQVLSADAMEPGTFRVDQTADRLYLQPPAGDNFSESTVEVSVRSRGWFTDLETNLTIRNLGVEHVATPWKNGLGAIVLAGSNHTIENVMSVQNNHIGLNLRGEDTKVRNCILNQNGHSGVSATEVKNLLLEGSVVNANNWRGALGGYTGWSVGNKFFKGRDLTIRGTSFNYNKSRGFWFDNDLKNALIEDVTLKGNLLDNIFLEQLQGPVTLRRVTSTESDAYGLLLGSAANVTVEDSRLVDNQKGGIHVSGLESGRTFTNFVSGEQMTVNTRHFSLQNSVISGVSGGVKAGSRNEGRFLIGTTFGPTWSDFLSTYEADYNTWYAEEPKAFESRGNTLLSFEEWQNETQEDQNSVFKNPQAPDSQVIPLQSGWNLISSTVEPGDSRVGRVFENVSEHIALVKNEAEERFVPESDENTLSTWDAQEAYVVYMEEPDTLRIQGEKTSTDTTSITLDKGWNLIPYVVDAPLSVENAFQSITDELVVVKDRNRQVYLPSFNLDQINRLEPGHGYKVYVSEKATLTYPSADAE